MTYKLLSILIMYSASTVFCMEKPNEDDILNRAFTLLTIEKTEQNNISTITEPTRKRSLELSNQEFELNLQGNIVQKNIQGNIAFAEFNRRTKKRSLTRMYLDTDSGEKNNYKQQISKR
jgi:hypothetical protein